MFCAVFALLKRRLLIVDSQDDVADYMFQELMVKTMDPVNLSLSAFQCFEEFFLHVNKRAKRIEQKEESSFLILQVPLVRYFRRVATIIQLNACSLFADWYRVCLASRARGQATGRDQEVNHLP